MPDDPTTAADQSQAESLDTLRRQLRDLARRIDPFPAFPGAMFAYGIEVPPPDGIATEVGCVILGNDGALYELQIGLDADQVALGADHVGSRHEELVPLDLPHDELCSYTRAALEVAEKYLEPQSRA